jgi:predicted metal-dependent hydrolase
MTTRTIRDGNSHWVFNVRRSRRRRTVALRVEPSGAITVYAPPYVWGPFIDRFVHQQIDWIQKKLEYFKSRPQPTAITPEQRTEFKRQTETRLTDVVPRLAAQLGVSPARVTVAHQNSRWGSCSRQGIVRFSSRMATLPDPVFDYIVIHELAHLKEMNHGPRFWRVVESLCPDHKVHRRWIRQNRL